MSEMATRVVNALAAPLPSARTAVSVRAAAPEDLPFIDALQKMHSHMVGFFPSKQIEKNIADGHVLIAEEVAIGCQRSAVGVGVDSREPNAERQAVQIGYVIAKYEYMKRDELGIVYQLNVMPIRHRHLVGATLIKAVFERAPYGCRLFCCWCAQDIQANWFWESIGFVPLAFRTGSRAKQRIHIFWQRRVRDNDDVTPYWFPAKTENGAIGEDRIVLPIPPGTHWRDAKPLILPGLPPPPPELPQLLPGGAAVKPRPEKPQLTKHQRAALARSQSGHLGGAPLGKKAIIRGGRIKYVEIPGFDPSVDGPDELANPAKQKKPRPRGQGQKNDPKYIAAARELRDRYLEQVNSLPLLPASAGKYDVSRQIASAGAPTELRLQPASQTPLLDAA